MPTQISILVLHNLRLFMCKGYSIQYRKILSACLNNPCTITTIINYYRPHPKDGEGNVFSLSTPGGGGGGGSGPASGGGGGCQHLAPSCGRYASCVHAGGLSCFNLVLISVSKFENSADSDCHLRKHVGVEGLYLLEVSGNEVLYFYQSFFAIVCHLICSNGFHKATDHSGMVFVNNENDTLQNINESKSAHSQFIDFVAEKGILTSRFQV